MTYTIAAVLGVGFAVGLDLVALRTNLLRRKVFWASYAIVFGFQLLVNGIFTGHRLVVYSAPDIIGGDAVRFVGDGRFCYAPIEDLLFGFSLVLQTLSWWVWWGRRITPASPASSRAARRRTGRS